MNQWSTNIYNNIVSITYRDALESEKQQQNYEYNMSPLIVIGHHPS